MEHTKLFWIVFCLSGVFRPPHPIAPGHHQASSTKPCSLTSAIPLSGFKTCNRALLTPSGDRDIEMQSVALGEGLKGGAARGPFKSWNARVQQTQLATLDNYFAGDPVK